MKTLAVILLALGLTACAAAPYSGEISCNSFQSLCYRGNVIDPVATRAQYGVQGWIELKKDYYFWRDD